MTKKLLIRSRSSGHNRFTENEGKAFHFLLKARVPLITRGVDDGEEAEECCVVTEFAT